MQIRLELTPTHQPKDKVKDLLKLDRVLFDGDARIKWKKCWVWIVRDNGVPVGYGAFRACEAKCNEGLAIFTRSGVLEKYRGRGIQKRLIRARLRLAKKLGFDQVVAYVADWNCASSNSLVRCGFKLYRPESLYAGYRYVYLKKTL